MWSLEEKASTTYLASEYQRQRVVRAGNFAMAQQWSALRAFHYRRHSWIKKQAVRQEAMQSYQAKHSEKRAALHKRKVTHMGSGSHMHHLVSSPSLSLHCTKCYSFFPSLLFLLLCYGCLTDVRKLPKKIKLSSLQKKYTVFLLLSRIWQLRLKCWCVLIGANHKTTGASNLLKSNPVEPKQVCEQWNTSRFILGFLAQDSFSLGQRLSSPLLTHHRAHGSAVIHSLTSDMKTFSHSCLNE